MQIVSLGKKRANSKKNVKEQFVTNVKEFVLKKLRIKIVNLNNVSNIVAQKINVKAQNVLKMEMEELIVQEHQSSVMIKKNVLAILVILSWVVSLPIKFQNYVKEVYNVTRMLIVNCGVLKNV
jgi:hypothetical protein